MVGFYLLTGTTSGSNPIGIKKTIKTNEVVKVENNALQIRSTGVFEVSGTVTLTCTTTGNTGLALYSGNEMIGDTDFSISATTGTEYIIPIYTVFKSNPSDDMDYAEIEFIPIGAPTIVSSMLAIKQIV